MAETTITSNQILKNKALTVKLYRKKPSRNKLDKAISADLSARMNVEDKTGLRVNKTIFTKESTTDFMSILNDAGKYYYRVTTPWDDMGFRLLSVDLYEDFTKAMKDFTRKFRASAEQFINSIDEQIEIMKGRMGDAFNREDYNHLYLSNGQIDRDAIMELFQCEIEYGVVADADDLRANLTEEDRAIIAEHITEQNQRKFAKTQKHIIATLHDCIFAIHERLCEKENIFRDTLISNLEDLVDLIPKMNIANDPEINKIAAEAKAKLCKWDAQTLRDNDAVREEVSKQADELVKNMAGLM